MKKHKFKGKELLEVVKRLQLRTMPAGSLIIEEGKPAEGFSIIVEGQCSKHVGAKSRQQTGIKDKFLRTFTKASAEESCPRYMKHAKVERVDSMAFSPTEIKNNIGKVMKQKVKDMIANSKN